VRRFTILDERGNWFGPALAAAAARGYETVHITQGVDSPKGGLGFLRPHADPRVLRKNQEHDWPFLRERLTMVQDQTQVEVYEDKSAQFWRYGKFMPPTWRFDNREKAVEFTKREATFPIVSKADVGASSVNVRIIHGRNDLLEHIKLAFTKGLPVDHCAGGGRHGRRAASLQRGYVLLQQFIPHDITWRVNRIGDHFAIFRRFNGAHGKAQTGNVAPLTEMDDVAMHVLNFARVVSDELKSKWIALDILERAGTVYLLETSLAWPWSADALSDTPFFGGTERKWGGMWDLMIDEYERGAFDANHLEAHV
jgi:hypothetical protein